MSNIEVLRKLTKIFNELKKDDEEGHSSVYELQWEDISTIENLIIENKKLIQENKELKEKVKGMYDKSNKLIEVTNLYLNSVPKSKIINLLENEVIDISGFECIPARDLQELLEE